MVGLWLLFSAVLLLAGLLYFEKQENRKAMVPVKGGLSALFIAAAALQPWPVPAYAAWILTGLVMSLAGDVLLALPGQRPFLIGLICFLSAHAAYVVAFFAAAPPSMNTLAVLLPIGAASLGVYRWLRPHLGSMKGPVIAYVLVISLMLAAAATFGLAGRHTGPGSVMAFSGALAFYISDLFVARDRFVNTGIRNRYAGLPLYYAGQFLLAYSTAMPEGF